MRATSQLLRLSDAAALPLDALRRRTLAWISHDRRLARTLGDRDRRVPWLACMQITCSFAIAVFAPMAAFVVGPLLLGVPHLASDLRYLVLRPAAPRAMLTLCVLASGSLLGLRGLGLLRIAVPQPAALEVSSGMAWVAAAFLLGARRARLRATTTSALLLALGVLTGCMLHHAATMRVLLAHLHNALGVLLWAGWFRKNKRHAWLPLGALLAACVVLASGWLLPLTLRSGGDTAFTLHLADLGRTLAPGLAPHPAAALVVSFVFLQSVHYAAWLVWIPQEQLPGQGTFTFRMSGRALLRDLGAPLLLVLASLWAALSAWAWLDTLAALRAYVSLVAFHAYLELAMLAYWLPQRSRRGAA